MTKNPARIHDVNSRFAGLAPHARGKSVRRSRVKISRGSGKYEVVWSMDVIGSDRAMGARWRKSPASARRIARVLAAAVMATTALLVSPLGSPFAAAAPCPDVEVVFARGTFEPPGIGVTGQAFVDALRSRVGGKSVDVYAVNYPASLDFATAADGVIDASN